MDEVRDGAERRETELLEEVGDERMGQELGRGVGVEGEADGEGGGVHDDGEGGRDVVDGLLENRDERRGDGDRG